MFKDNDIITLSTSDGYLLAWNITRDVHQTVLLTQDPAQASWKVRRIIDRYDDLFKGYQFQCCAPERSTEYLNGVPSHSEIYLNLADYPGTFWAVVDNTNTTATGIINLVCLGGEQDGPRFLYGNGASNTLTLVEDSYGENFEPVKWHYAVLS